MEELNIIYEDENIIGIIKPYGVLSCGENSIESKLKIYNGGYIGVVHRLDRTTQGVMIFSKNQKTTSYLSTLIKEHKINKEYYAIVEGYLEKESDTLNDLLFFDRKVKKSFVVKKERKGIKLAKLYYEVIETKNDMSLVRIKLFTGRTHQIRVQFSNLHHPLIGDRRYGSKKESKNIMLTSSHISFYDEQSKKEIDLTFNPSNEYFGDFI